MALPVETASVDAAVDRSVLFYVDDKRAASLDRAPNPLWPPIIDLVRDALGPETDAYVAFMMAGVDDGGYRFTCPAAFVTGVRSLERRSEHHEGRGSGSPAQRHQPKDPIQFPLACVG